MLLNGPRIEVRQGTPGRERVAVRDHDDAEAAHRWAVKEEWGRLKKGMALLNPDASWGEPRLHRFVGGAYTGAMTIAPAGDGGFFCNRFVQADEMIHVGPGGDVTVGLALPGERLAWKVARRHRQLGRWVACERRLSRVGEPDDDTSLPQLRRLPVPG